MLSFLDRQRLRTWLFSRVQIDVTAELKDRMQEVFDNSTMPEKFGVGRNYQQKENFKYSRCVGIACLGILNLNRLACFSQVDILPLLTVQHALPNLVLLQMLAPLRLSDQPLVPCFSLRVHQVLRVENRHLWVEYQTHIAVLAQQIEVQTTILRIGSRVFPLSPVSRHVRLHRFLCTQDIEPMSRQPLTEPLNAGLNLKTQLNEVLLFHGTKVSMVSRLVTPETHYAFRACATARNIELHHERRLRPKANIGY